MEGYGLVSSDPSWTWVVEKQCFVSWTDDEGPNCLGELSPRNSTVKLSINIGWRPDSKEMLIALHLPISSRGSKYARDMFMIIPNTFDTSKLDTTFAPVQVPGRKDLDNAGFAYCNLFHIPVTVAKPCDVIMPQTQRQKTLKGTPRVLVSKLKSLSEARAFDIYCRFDTFAQVELRKVFAKIDQLEMPLLLLDSIRLPIPPISLRPLWMCRYPVAKWSLTPFRKAWTVRRKTCQNLRFGFECAESSIINHQSGKPRRRSPESVQPALNPCLIIVRQRESIPVAHP
jgi:hypothetical protein